MDRDAELLTRLLLDPFLTTGEAFREAAAARGRVREAGGEPDGTAVANEGGPVRVGEHPRPAPRPARPER